MKGQGGSVRRELKFLVASATWERLRPVLEQQCGPDPHAGEGGVYTVASIYYDTEQLRFYWDREESVGYRRKVRLRAYVTGDVIKALFFEIKEKHRNLVAKKRVALPQTALETFSQVFSHTSIGIEEILDQAPNDSAAVREILYLHRRLLLRPTVLVRYQRATFVGKHHPSLRVTFDYRLSCGGRRLDRSDELSERPLLEPTLGILEIKCDESAPLWLAQAVADCDVLLGRYSKYCAAIDTLFGRPPDPTLVRASFT